MAEYVDILQIGARNMQNYGLLQAVGKTQRPVMLKRGISGEIQELLMCAEYILSNGNMQVMLCERGIRTYETATRNTFDLNAIPVLKRASHLPVVADPAHGTGDWELVPPMSLAAVAAGGRCPHSGGPPGPRGSLERRRPESQTGTVRGSDVQSAQSRRGRWPFDSNPRRTR